MAELQEPEISHSKTRSEDSGSSTGKPGQQHKPLHLTKSDPSFRGSSPMLNVEEFEGRKSRSQSAPLSIEAVQVARQLKRASDLFHDNYVLGEKKKIERRRRLTVSGSHGESLQNDIRMALGLKGINANRHSLGSPLEGTPV